MRLSRPPDFKGAIMIETSAFPAAPAFMRSPQLAWFGGLDDPRLNVTALMDSIDFTTPARARNLPSFAVLFHALAGASLDVEAFCWRLDEDGAPVFITGLTPSYTVQNNGGHVNFSYVPFTEDINRFIADYLRDRDQARAASEIRLNRSMPQTHGRLYCSSVPFLRFSSVEHPRGGARAAASIPHIVVGQWRIETPGRLSFPLSVQAHHGLVDGIHVAQYFKAVAARLDMLAEKLN